MLAVLLGSVRFREACDLYFDRHDGEGATIDDFLACMEEASGIDLSHFVPWYKEAGTPRIDRSEGHTSELQSLMRISYAVFCLKKKKTTNTTMSIYNEQTII